MKPQSKVTTPEEPKKEPPAELTPQAEAPPSTESPPVETPSASESEGDEVRSVLPQTLPDSEKSPAPVDNLAQQASDAMQWGFRLTDKSGSNASTSVPPPAVVDSPAEPTVPEGFGSISETGDKDVASTSDQDVILKESDKETEENPPETVLDIVETVVEDIAEKVGEDIVEDAAKAVRGIADEALERVGDVVEMADFVGDVTESVSSTIDVVQEVLEAADKAAEEAGIPDTLIDVTEAVVEGVERIVDAVNYVAEKVEDVGEAIQKEVEDIKHEAVELVESEEKREEMAEKIVEYVKETTSPESVVEGQKLEDDIDDSPSKADTISVSEKVGEDIVEDAAEAVSEVTDVALEKVSEVVEVADVVGDVTERVSSTIDVVQEVLEAADKTAEEAGIPDTLIDVTEAVVEGVERIVDSINFVAEKVEEVGEAVQKKVEDVKHEAAELAESEEKKEELVEKIVEFVKEITPPEPEAPKLEDDVDESLSKVGDVISVSEVEAPVSEPVVEVTESPLEIKEPPSDVNEPVPEFKEPVVAVRKQGLFDKLLSLFSKDEGEKEIKEFVDVGEEVSTSKVEASGAVDQAKEEPMMSESEPATAGAEQIMEEPIAPESQFESPIAEAVLPIVEHVVEDVAEGVGEVVVEKAAETVVEVTTEVEKEADLISETAAFVEKVGGEAETVLKVTEDISEAASEAAKEVPGVPAVVEEVIERIEDVAKEAEVVVDTITNVAEKVEEIAKEVVEEAKVIETKAVELVESEEKREELIEKVAEYIGEKLSEESHKIEVTVDTTALSAETTSANETSKIEPVIEEETETALTVEQDGKKMEPISSEVPKTLVESQVAVEKQGLFDKLLSLFSKDEDDKESKESINTGEEVSKAKIEAGGAVDQVKEEPVMLESEPVTAGVEQIMEEPVVHEPQLESPVAETVLPVVEHVVEDVAEKIGEEVVEKAAETVVEVTKEVEREADLIADVAASVEKVGGEAETVIKVTEDITEAAFEAAKEVPEMPAIVEEVIELIEDVAKEAEVIVDTVTNVAEKVEEIAEEVVEEAKVIEAKAVELLESEEKREELIEKVTEYIGEKLLEESHKTEVTVDTTALTEEVTSADDVESLESVRTDDSPVTVKNEGLFDKFVSFFKDKKEDAIPSEGKALVEDSKEPVFEGHSHVQDLEEPVVEVKTVNEIEEISKPPVESQAKKPYEEEIQKPLEIEMGKSTEKLPQTQVKEIEMQKPLELDEAEPKPQEKSPGTSSELLSKVNQSDAQIDILETTKPTEKEGLFDMVASLFSSDKDKEIPVNEVEHATEKMAEAPLEVSKKDEEAVPVSVVDIEKEVPLAVVTEPSLEANPPTEKTASELDQVAVDEVQEKEGLVDKIIGLFSSDKERKEITDESKAELTRGIEAVSVVPEEPANMSEVPDETSLNVQVVTVPEPDVEKAIEIPSSIEKVLDTPVEVAPAESSSQVPGEASPDIAVETTLEVHAETQSEDISSKSTAPNEISEIFAPKEKEGLVRKLANLFSRDKTSDADKVTETENENEKKATVDVSEVEVKESTSETEETNDLVESRENILAAEPLDTEVTKTMPSAEPVDIKEEIAESGGLFGKLIDFFSTDTEKRDPVPVVEDIAGVKETEPSSASDNIVDEASDRAIAEEADFVFVEHHDVEKDREAVVERDDIAGEHDRSNIDSPTVSEKSGGLVDKFLNFISGEGKTEETDQDKTLPEAAPQLQDLPEIPVTNEEADSKMDVIPKDKLEEITLPENKEVKEEFSAAPEESPSGPVEKGGGGGFFGAIGSLFVRENRESSEQIAEPVIHDKSDDVDISEDIQESHPDVPSEVTSVVPESPVLEVKDSSLFDKLADLVSVNDKKSRDSSDTTPTDEVLPQEVPKASEDQQQSLLEPSETETKSSETESKPSIFDRVASIFSKDDESVPVDKDQSSGERMEEDEGKPSPDNKETTHDEEDTDVFVVLSKPTTPVETPVPEEGQQEAEKASGWLQGSWFRVKL